MKYLLLALLCISCTNDDKENEESRRKRIASALVDVSPLHTTYGHWQAGDFEFCQSLIGEGPTEGEGWEPFAVGVAAHASAPTVYWKRPKK